MLSGLSEAEQWSTFFGMKRLLKVLSYFILILALLGGCTVPPRDIDHDQVTVIAVFDQFMQAGERNDPRAGIELVSVTPPAPELTPEQVTTLFRNRRDLIEGYQSLDRDVSNIGLSAEGFGMRAMIRGKVSYTGRRSVPYTVRLVKRADEWKLGQVQFR